MNGSHEMLRITLTSVALVSALACQPRTEGHADRANSAIAAATPARAELALAYRASSDSAIDETIKAAQHLVRTRPSDVQSTLGLAKALIDKKRITGDAITLAYAADALDAAEAIDAKAPGVLALRGVLLREDHKFAELAKLAERLIKAEPADSTGYLLLGDAKLEQGDYDGATAAYENAMERLPDLRVYSRGAFVRWLYGDIEGALEMMDAALESAGGNREHLAWCLTDVGLLFLRRGEIDRAVAAADRAEKMVANYPAAKALRARAQFAAGKLDAAASEIREALKARVVSADHFLLAEIEEARGDEKAASAAAAAGLKLADHDPIPAVTYLARRGDDTNRAIELSTREVDERPTVFAFAASALAHYRGGNTESAAAMIAKALELGTPLAELHLAQGLIKLAAGDEKGAREALARAESINPVADPRLAGELRTKLEAI